MILTFMLGVQDGRRQAPKAVSNIFLATKTCKSDLMPAPAFARRCAHDGHFEIPNQFCEILIVMSVGTLNWLEIIGSGLVAMIAGWLLDMFFERRDRHESEQP